MTAADLLIAPFADYAFMKRALAGCIILALSGTPLGLFMNLRGMALTGDAMSHAILPGISIAFLFFGLSILPMTVAALVAGILVALVALWLVRYTHMKEDTGFTLIYLLSLASGVIMISRGGSNIDLLHILFGNILGIDDAAIMLAAGVACLTALVFSQIYRTLVIQSFDPDFVGAVRGRSYTSALFFVLVVLNLVAAFQVLGTLMALGLMILPAIAASFWSRRIDHLVPLSVGIAIACSYAGLLVSYHANLPAGASVVSAAGMFCVISLLCGRVGSVLAYRNRA